MVLISSKEESDENDNYLVNTMKNDLQYEEEEFKESKSLGEFSQSLSGKLSKISLVFDFITYFLPKMKSVKIASKPAFNLGSGSKILNAIFKIPWWVSFAISFALTLVNTILIDLYSETSGLAMALSSTFITIISALFCVIGSIKYIKQFSILSTYHKVVGGSLMGINILGLLTSLTALILSPAWKRPLFPDSEDNIPKPVIPKPLNSENSQEKSFITFKLLQYETLDQPHEIVIEGTSILQKEIDILIGADEDAKIRRKSPDVYIEEISINNGQIFDSMIFIEDNCMNNIQQSIYWERGENFYTNEIIKISFNLIDFDYIGDDQRNGNDDIYMHNDKSEVILFYDIKNDMLYLDNNNDGFYNDNQPCPKDEYGYYVYGTEGDITGKIWFDIVKE